MKWKLLGTAAIAAALAFGCTHKEAEAADKESHLGGSCCADLEERVAELEAMTVRKGTSKMSVTVSGHVNPSIVWHDVDEFGLDNYDFRDNDLSESRVNFKGSAVINDQWSAGFMLSLGLSDAINNGGPITVRESYGWLKVKNFGTISLGHQSTATDGIQELSLSKGASNASVLGSLAPFDSFIEDQTGFNVVNPFDGGRKDSLRFRSSSIGGFQISASWADDDTWDVALKFAHDFGKIQVVAGVGYRDEEDDVGGGTIYYGGSASIKHVTSGLFVDATYGVSDGDQYITLMGMPFLGADLKLTVYGARAGIDMKASTVGLTTIFAEYQVLEEGDATIDLDGDVTMWGVGFNQAIDAASTDVYISYRNYDLGDLYDQNVQVVVGGVKVRF